MAWFNTYPDAPKYRFLFAIIRNRSGFWGNMGDYTYMARGPELKQMSGILRQFLQELESQSELIQMVEPRNEPNPIPASQCIVGGPIHTSQEMVFSVLEEDVANLCTDKPVHFMCSTEIGTDDKDEFIRVINFFI